MKQLFISVIIMTSILSSCCSPAAPVQQTTQPTWDSQLSAMLPYLGHRNWIVIADMAYPSQSGQGITTLYADEPYADVLKKVKDMIDAAPHVFAHIYNDREILFVDEADSKGISRVREDIKAICGEESTYVMHEKLISRLDEAGKLFSVVIIKTPLTNPYTTTFFELDCAYWGPAKQAILDAAIAAAGNAE